MAQIFQSIMGDYEEITGEIYGFAGYFNMMFYIVDTLNFFNIFKNIFSIS